MTKGKSLRSFFLHIGLWLLILEAAAFVIAWLLFRLWYWVPRFSDVLLLVGVLQVMAASVGMLNRPYEVSNSPWGVPVLPVQATEQEKRWQSIATLIEQKSFAVRMIVCGAITLLLAVILSYMNY